MESSKENSQFDVWNFLEEGQRKQVLNFMDMTGIKDREMAVEIMETNNYDQQKALNLFLGGENTSSPTTPPPQPSVIQNNNSYVQNNQPPIMNNSNINYGGFNNHILPGHLESEFIRNMGFDDNQNMPPQSILKEYQIFLRNQEENEGIFKNFGQKTKNVFKSMIPQFLRPTSLGGEEFKVYMNKMYSKSMLLNFQNGSIQQNLTDAQNNGQPLLILLFSDEPCLPRQLIDLQLDLMKSIELRNLTKKFHLLGLLYSSAESEALTEHVQSSHWPCFITLKRNLFDKIVVVDFVTIEKSKTEIQYYEERIQTFEKQYFVLEREDNSIINEVKRRRQQKQFYESGMFLVGPGAYHQPFPPNHYNQNIDPVYHDQTGFYQPYVPPYSNSSSNIRPSPQMSQSEIQKQQQAELKQMEDQQIKKMQEQEYLHALKINQEQENKQQMEDEQQKKQESENIKKISQYEEQRAIKFSQIEQEPEESESTITIVFRLLNGNKLTRRFLLSDTAQLLFDFIDVTPNIGFPASNKFFQYDLIQSRPQLSLRENIEQQLEQVFPDSNSQTLYVQDQQEQ